MKPVLAGASRVFMASPLTMPSPSVVIHDRDELVRLFGEGTMLARAELPVTLYGGLAEHAIAERRNVPPEHRPYAFGALQAPERPHPRRREATLEGERPIETPEGPRTECLYTLETERRAGTGGKAP